MKEDLSTRFLVNIQRIKFQIILFINIIMFQISLSSRAEKELKRLSGEYRKRVEKLFRILV